MKLLLATALLLTSFAAKSHAGYRVKDPDECRRSETPVRLINNYTKKTVGWECVPRGEGSGYANEEGELDD